MTTVLCTLYNSLYLDKGLVLYDSLCECAKDFKLYVLCMDDKCYEVLTDLKQEHHIPVRLSDFEAGDEALLKAKGNRSMGEYCWTCSSSFIRYVLKHYGEDSCTYIDADMAFYNDPQILIDEMLAAKKSVMVVPHRFPEGRKDEAKIVGEYCVEFNTFVNNEEALAVLEYWRNRCLECCSSLGDGVHWGDQKYLEELVEKFDCVHVCQHPGAGLAQWNLILYNTATQRTIVYRPSNEVNELIFIHYQNISYISRRIIKLGLKKNLPLDYRFVDMYYKEYLKEIDIKKQELKKKYDVDTLILSHPAMGKGNSFIKNTFISRYYWYYKHLKNGQVLVRL